MKLRIVGFAILVGVGILLQACGGGSPGAPAGDCSQPGQTVTIADAGLRNVIRGSLGIPTAPITCRDMQAIDALNGNTSSIASLEGLQHATNLRDLSLQENAITNIAPLEHLSKLESLNISQNQISSVTPLEGITSLQYLDLTLNQISTTTPLRNLTKLHTLYLGSNQISDIATLEILTTLKTLNLSNNQVRSVTRLQSLVNLESLQLQENRITSITPLVANYGLGEGDKVWVNLNCLDLTPGSAAMADIAALTARGVDVVSDPQSVCTS